MAPEAPLTIAALVAVSVAACATSFVLGAFYWEVRLYGSARDEFYRHLPCDPQFWMRGSPKCPFSSDEQLEEYRRQYEIRAAKRLAWSREKEKNS